MKLNPYKNIWDLNILETNKIESSPKIFNELEQFLGDDQLFPLKLDGGYMNGATQCGEPWNGGPLRDSFFLDLYPTL